MPLKTDGVVDGYVLLKMGERWQEMLSYMPETSESDVERGRKVTVEKEVLSTVKPTPDVARGKVTRRRRSSNCVN